MALYAISVSFLVFPHCLAAKNDENHLIFNCAATADQILFVGVALFVAQNYTYTLSVAKSLDSVQK